MRTDELILMLQGTMDDNNGTMSCDITPLKIYLYDLLANIEVMMAGAHRDNPAADAIDMLSTAMCDVLYTVALQTQDQKASLNEIKRGLVKVSERSYASALIQLDQTTKADPQPPGHTQSGPDHPPGTPHTPSPDPV